MPTTLPRALEGRALCSGNHSGHKLTAQCSNVVRSCFPTQLPVVDSAVLLNHHGNLHSQWGKNRAFDVLAGGLQTCGWPLDFLLEGHGGPQLSSADRCFSSSAGTCCKGLSGHLCACPSVW
ncbi:hypothetical protein MC885_013385 [Smutsia gigantea]|nr:hypothetical protein MC885_013385 [Smutsia gigantea]